MTVSKQDGINLEARSRAQASIEGIVVKPTGLVEYRSNGRIAIVGGPEAIEFAPRLQEKHQVHVILSHGCEEPGAAVIAIGGRKLAITGYLGNFTVALGEKGKPSYEELKVDMVLDLGPDPVLSMPMLPPGYLHTSNDENCLVDAIDQLDEWIGTFEKPRFFSYDASICAHARSGQSGCNQCIEACPAEAITSLVEAIEVNPYLCQGGGICASVCPSGAIRYVYPSAGDMLDKIRTLLQVYHEYNGVNPVIAFIAEEDITGLSDIPSNLLPVVVEETGSVGIDIWLAALAYGARSVLLAKGGNLSSRVCDALQAQLQIVSEILLGMGYPGGAVRMVSVDEVARESRVVLPETRAAAFTGLSEKRRTLFLALDHLYDHGTAKPGIIPLSNGALFGAISVDPNACTLCFSCTSVCPSHAVYAANETPKLLFNEGNCVQCGICVSTCPEHAIEMIPRLLADPDTRQHPATLHEEAPFCCVTCGKPFATRSAISAVMKKIEGHWMFRNERAKQRLMMCEDCRVVDIAQDPEAMEQGFRTSKHM